MLSHRSIRKEYLLIGSAVIRGQSMSVSCQRDNPRIIVIADEEGKELKYLRVDYALDLNQSDNEHTE